MSQMIGKKQPKTVEITINTLGKKCISSFSQKFSNGVSERIAMTDQEKEALSGLIGVCGIEKEFAGGIVCSNQSVVEPVIPRSTAEALVSGVKKITPQIEALMKLDATESECLKELIVALS